MQLSAMNWLNTCYDVYEAARQQRQLELSLTDNRTVGNSRNDLYSADGRGLDHHNSHRSEQSSERFKKNFL